MAWYEGSVVVGPTQHSHEWENKKKGWTTNAEGLSSCFLCNLHLTSSPLRVCVLWHKSRAVVFDSMSGYQNEMPGLGCLPLLAFAVAIYPDPFPILRSCHHVVFCFHFCFVARAFAGHVMMSCHFLNRLKKREGKKLARLLISPLAQKPNIAFYLQLYNRRRDNAKLLLRLFEGIFAA